MNQNLNSLVSRMLANAKQQQQPATTGSTTTNNNIKRNLFGIHLNHDQLKQDLNEMWQDQLERKKCEWNFDFESLKPIEKINNNNNESRYEWNQVKTTNLNQTNSDLVLTTFDSSELFSDDDHEEEDDEALAMPAFYKYQRRQKLNGFKFIQIEQPTTTTKIVKQQQTAFSKLKQQSNTNKLSNNRCLHKPKPVKQTTKASKQNLIITLSENRKDTLRSAVASTSSTSTKRDLTNKSSKSAFKQPNIKSSSIESTPMKQQSLLDMLKQRKRKTPSTSNTIAKITDSSNNSSTNNNNNIASCISGLGNSIVHNLRPRTISFN